LQHDVAVHILHPHVEENSMDAYLIADVAQIEDEATYATYRSRVADGILNAGGRYLARGGGVDVLEGTWCPSRIVIVRFESVAAARRWWSSNEYAELKRMRQDSTRTNMVVVQGLDEGLIC
jgi:uncharacterized protein (DUF1330 family)